MRIISLNACEDESSDTLCLVRVGGNALSTAAACAAGPQHCPELHTSSLERQPPKNFPPTCLWSSPTDGCSAGL